MHEHSRSRKNPPPTIQELLKKHIKPGVPLTPIARFTTSKYNSLERNEDQRTFSRDRSIHNLSTKRKAVMLDDSSVSMQGTFSQSDANSVKNGRRLLEKIGRRHHLLTPVDHEISHKVIRRPMPPIGGTVSGSSDNEVEISLKHIDAARSRLIEDESNSRKTLQT